jgi:hypothetical protein
MKDARIKAGAALTERCFSAEMLSVLYGFIRPLARLLATAQPD